ncbi:amidase signature enzyme [Sarocladium strictum]
MSIVAISDGANSKITNDNLHQLASHLIVASIDEQDTQDYLTILRSFEAVLDEIDDAPDCVPNALQAHVSSQPRAYWRPSHEDNVRNAWSHRCDIRSSDLEATPNKSLLLAGRTVAIKDNVSVQGLPMTIGIPESLFPNGKYPIATVDASVVSRILGAGGIIKGTSTCESFCASPLSFTSATGLVHNALLHGYTSGGSSSGSAVLVASHVLKEVVEDGNWGETVELAIGSDQAGSVRNPACYSGIYGLKPTFGLVPYTGAASMTPMIDHIGPLAPDLEGIAALLEVMAGYDGFDPRMSPESPLRDQVKPYLTMLKEVRADPSASGRALKVGLLKESFEVAGLSEEVRDTIRKAAKVYLEAAGAKVVEISVPMHTQGPVIWTAATRPSMSSHLCQGRPSGHLSYLPSHARIEWPPSQDTYETLTANNPAVVNIMLSELYARTTAKPGLEAKAHRKAFELRVAYDHALAQVDVLIAPCAPTVAVPHPKPAEVDGKKTPILERLGAAVGATSNTCPFNITGHPAMSVPCGFATDTAHPDVKLPIGMQIIGRRWRDEDVIKAAAIFEYGRELGTAELG